MTNNNTARFDLRLDKNSEAEQIMQEVLLALEEKGYNPINQLVGYFLSGDPTYITNHRGARAVIRRMERDELLEVIIRLYCEQLKNKR
ncbi:IreB family regulatory phosphoprotein [Amygdalobacter nucleatus]|uniref:Uncharacterized protein n=1 Tax=Amygdalobacter nucleatus TaxID=3029274 RepID=A0A133YED7_9FIRM|nr:IreB family regulatory phosphoprotein [Amygdalobacter nucleatus]KXB41555.1 hypothetical protein HMPREF1872_00643 [Amygdalobacter nucleatus]MDF0485606.1 IreB family regulatory phosphoprotein [Amygdalobacter nucleatus]WEG36541.1 IreB family regulatory phosphoprotein [Amygdalobacter nucleatus]